MLDFIKNIGPVEWAILLIILVMVFGGKIVTRLGKTTGETVREIKKAKKTFTDALEDDDTSKKDK